METTFWGRFFMENKKSCLIKIRSGLGDIMLNF